MADDAQVHGTDYKDIADINLKTLVDDLAVVLSNQVGGRFSVITKKAEQTNPGFSNNKLILEFVVEDESAFQRPPSNDTMRMFQEDKG